MAAQQWSWLLLFYVVTVCALRYDPSQLAYNVNTNQTANVPTDYWGEWGDHTFNPSPLNWRLPIYTVMLDRFVNGNPTNDDANGTQFEHDLTQTQLRNGGDIKGLQDSLDYVQGMGIKVGFEGHFDTEGTVLTIPGAIPHRQPAYKCSMGSRWIQPS